MPIDYLAPNRVQFDYLDSLQALGNARGQDLQNQSSVHKLIEMGQQRDLRQQVAGQARSGDYQGASQAALKGGDIELAKTLAGLGDADRKRAGQEARILAATASRLRSLPEAQRAQAYAQVAPMLRQYGFAQHELDSPDLSDQGLDGYIQHGHSVLESTDPQDEPSVIRTLRAVGIDPQSVQGRDIVTRSLAAPRYLPNGDGTFTVMGGMSPSAAGPNASSPPAAPSASPPPEAIAALRAGHGSAAQFDEIFGHGAAAQVMGGAPSQGGATFP